MWPRRALFGYAERRVATRAGNVVWIRERPLSSPPRYAPTRTSSRVPTRDGQLVLSKLVNLPAE